MSPESLSNKATLEGCFSKTSPQLLWKILVSRIELLMAGVFLNRRLLAMEILPVSAAENSMMSQCYRKMFPVGDICRGLSNYLYEELTKPTPNCAFCPKEFTCSNFVIPKPSSLPIIIPNEEIIEQITLESIEDHMAIIDGNFYAHHLVDDDLETLSQFEEQCAPSPEPAEEHFHTFEAPKGFLRLMDTLIEEEEAISDEHLLEFFMLQSCQQIFPQPVELESCSIADMCDLSYYGLTEQYVRDCEHQTTSSSNEIETPLKRSQEQSLFANNTCLISDEFDDEDATPPDIVPSPEKPSGNVSITQLVNYLNQPSTTSSKNQTLRASTRFFGDSDDDFEESILCNRSRFHGQKEKGSASQKENVKTPTTSKAKKNASTKREKKKFQGNEFLDLEAEVSSEEGVLISNDEDEISDGYEMSFVNDKTQLFNTQIHGMYLRSVK